MDDIPFYLTGPEHCQAALKTYAERLGVHLTHPCWFEEENGTKPQRVNLVEAIKQAWKGILIVPKVSDLDSLAFELGVMAAADYQVFVLYEEEDVPDRLAELLPYHNLLCYRDFEALLTNVCIFLYDSANAWDSECD